MSRGLGRVQRDLLRAVARYDDNWSRSCWGTSAGYLAAAAFHPTERRWASETEKRSARRALARLLAEGYVVRDSRYWTGFTCVLTDKGRMAARHDREGKP